MNRPIIGATVGTPISPARVEKEIHPVKTINGISADKDGNIDINIPSGGGITKNAITLLISVLRNAVYTNDQSETITALEKALNDNASSGGSGGGNTGGDGGGDTGETEATLVSISVTYSGGKVPIGTSVNNLEGVVVTAIYSDGSTQTVTDYTLSGTIVEGSNIITVSYGGKNTTFIVTGIIDISDGYVSDGLEFRLDAIRNSGVSYGGGQHSWDDVSGNGWKTRNSDGRTFVPHDTYLEVATRGQCQVIDSAPLLAKMADAFTVEIVYQPANAADKTGLFTVGNGDNYYVISANGQFRVPGAATTYGTAMSNTNAIRHYTLVYDGTKLAMYHDGVFDAEKSVTFDISSVATDLEFFGNLDYASPIAGTYNAVRLYTRALSESEIVANYSNDIARFGTVNVNLEVE